MSLPLLAMLALPLMMVAAGRRPRFVKVRVRIVIPLNSAIEAFEITDAKTIARLESYFPEMGQTPKPVVQWKWVALAVLEFIDKDGQATRIAFAQNHWSERRGDWPLPEGFLDYFNKLVKREAAKQSKAAKPKSKAAKG